MVRRYFFPEPYKFYYIINKNLTRRKRRHEEQWCEEITLTVEKGSPKGVKDILSEDIGRQEVVTNCIAKEESRERQSVMFS